MLLNVVYLSPQKHTYKKESDRLHNHSTFADNYDQDDTIISFPFSVNLRR